MSYLKVCRVFKNSDCLDGYLFGRFIVLLGGWKGESSTAKDLVSE